MSSSVPWSILSTAELIQQGVLMIGDGYRAKNAEFIAHGGLPFVRVGDVQSTVRTVGLDELPLSEVDRYAPKVSQAGDSLITMKGTVGRVARVSAVTPPFVYSPQISFWRILERSRLVPEFLTYWLKGPEFEGQALATKGATDMADYINLRDQRRMRITLPPPETQRRIAAVLSAFDDLIEINERRIELLEDLARSLYHEWFVRSSPPGNGPGSTQADLPPGRELVPLAELAEVNGATLGADELPDPLRYLDISLVGIGECKLPDQTAAALAPGRARRNVSDGDVVWSTVRPNRRAHALVLDPPENLVASTGLAVLTPTDVPFSYLAALASSQPFTDYLVQHSSGSAYPAVRPRDFEQMPVVRPDGATLARFHEASEPTMRETAALRAQNDALAATRDLLLPRLVTGRLDIDHVDLGDLLSEPAAAA